MSAEPRDIINKWPSLTAFADDAGVTYGAAKKMRRRNSISVEYWARLVEAAGQRGLSSISYELLALAHAAPEQEAAA